MLLLEKKESGKTIILDLIIGLHEIKSGTIKIDIINIYHFSKKIPKILKNSFRENIILNRTIYSYNLIKICELTNLYNRFNL